MRKPENDKKRKAKITTAHVPVVIKAAAARKDHPKASHNPVVKRRGR